MTSAVFLHAGAAGAVLGEELVLYGAEARHAAVVRRTAVGERIRLTDGTGAYADGEVVAVGTKPPAVTVRVEAAGRTPPPSPRLVVLQAVPKSDRAQLTVEVLTEIGADVIVPWNADRSQQKWTRPQLERLLERWQGWSVAAGKQARRTRFVEIAEPVSTGDALALVGDDTLALVLHEESAEPLAAAVDARPGAPEVLLVVGPEGGLTDEELERFAAAGAVTVRLGDEVLRTSTAGLTAAAAVLSRTRWLVAARDAPPGSSRSPGSR